jgi:predicted permease
MRVLWQDLRFAARLLRSNPGFTALAVLSLALGIGVNTAIFGLVRAVLLPSLPVADAARLVSIYHRYTRGHESLSSTSYPDYEYYRDHNQVLAGLMAYGRVPMSVRIGEQAEQISGELVTANYFSVLGLQATAGRTFLAGDGAVAVIGDRLWRSRFGGDRNVLGRTIGVGRHTFTIVGIAPPRFRGVVLDWGDPPELWVPMAAFREAVPILPEDFLQLRGDDWLLVTGRLKPGVSMVQAQAAIRGMAGQLTQAYPAIHHDWTAELLPLSRARFWPSYRNSIVTFLELLAAVTGLVLLIACFNVANLLVTRGLKRQREIAVRLALGAGRGRVVRQLTTESVLLSLVGGAAGVAVASWTAAFVSLYPRPFKIPLALDTHLDVPALGFALLLSLATGVVFGLIPARRASRPDLALSLKSEAPGPGLRGFALRNALVVAQVALSLVLLIGAGLFVRTLRNAQASDPAFRTGSAVLVDLDLAVAGYSDARGKQFYAEALERARLLSGVEAPALVWMPPLGDMRGGTDVLPPGASRPLQVNWNIASPGYFRTLGLPLVRGRDFDNRDTESAPRVAVVNEVMARRFWPREDPLGKLLHLAKPGSLPLEVVGVVRDGRMQNFREDPRPCFYRPLAQSYVPEMTLIARTPGGPDLALAEIRRELRALDKDLPVAGAETMHAHLDRALSQERLTASLLSGLGLLALALAVIGIYGVMSFSVAQRTREIGIRMALGAQAPDVLTMILRHAAILLGTGLAIGWAAAALVTRYAVSLLYGVSPTDPWTFVAVSAVLAPAAMLACYLPARRAARVDPMVALRYE